MAAMTVISKVLLHFFGISKDQLVASRDLLIHGKRANIDMAIYQLIKNGIVWRVARGVFIRAGGRWPTVEEIAIFKAGAFGREIRQHGGDAASEFHLETHSQQSPTYYVDGGSSAFDHAHGRIAFKGISKKRIYLEENPVGRAIRTLWARGKENFRLADIRNPHMPWNSERAAVDAVLLGRRWMPAWLGDCFQTDAYLGPRPI